MKLHWKIIIGMAAGVVVGLIVNESSYKTKYAGIREIIDALEAAL